MTHVVTAGCVDVMDRACTTVCPLDCMYEGNRALYINPNDINPNECIDCNECEPACPSQAILYEEALPDELIRFLDDNARFFHEPLLSRPEALGTLRGVAKVSPIGIDTNLASTFPSSSLDPLSAGTEQSRWSKT